MNLKAKFLFSVGLLGLLCITLPGSLRADTVNFDSIDTSASPYYVNISTTSYLAQYGITLAGVTSGTVDVLCATCAGDTLVPSSSPNVLVQFGSDYGESYTLDFSTPLSELSFDVAGNSKSGGSGTLVAAWSATAYNASNAEVSSVGAGMLSTYSAFAPQPYTLMGPGITSATFYTQCNGSCGTLLAIDDISSPELAAVATPEPSSLLMLGAGLLTLVGIGWWRNSQAASGSVLS